MFDFFKKHKDKLNNKAIDEPEIVAEFFAKTMMEDKEFKENHEYFKKFVNESDIDLKETIVKYVQASFNDDKKKISKYGKKIMLKYQLYELEKE